MGAYRESCLPSRGCFQRVDVARGELHYSPAPRADDVVPMLARRPRDRRTAFVRMNPPKDAEFAEEIERPIDCSQAKFRALGPSSLEDLSGVQATLCPA